MLTRTCLQEQIKNLLIGILKSVESGWVVIHGMPGSGKSLLAAAALRSCAFEDELLLRNIFWIRIGNSVNEEGLLTKIHMLCEKLDASYRDSLPCNIEMASDRLRALLHSDVHKNSLIVLDDVWDDYVIRHFDLGSPILLTTRDKSVMDVTCSKVHYVELNNGFTLDESRRFLSCSLSIKEECLPQSVDEICSRTKGDYFCLCVFTVFIFECLLGLLCIF